MKACLLLTMAIGLWTQGHAIQKSLGAMGARLCINSPQLLTVSYPMLSNRRTPNATACGIEFLATIRNFTSLMTLARFSTNKTTPPMELIKNEQPIFLLETGKTTEPPTYKKLHFLPPLHATEGDEHVEPFKNMTEAEYMSKLGHLMSDTD